MRLVRIEPDAERYFNLDLVAEVQFQDEKAYVVLSNGAAFRVTDTETMQLLNPCCKKSDGVILSKTETFGEAVESVADRIPLKEPQQKLRPTKSRKKAN